MKLDIQPLKIVLAVEVSQVFTSVSYTVTYDNEFDNSKVGLDPGICTVNFPLPAGPGQPSIKPIVILGTAKWTDEQVTAEILKRLGASVAVTAGNTSVVSRANAKGRKPTP